jgi:hypothetical protein
MPKGEKFWLPPNLKYRQIYLCLWEMPDGRYIGNSDGEFMCAESFTLADKSIERKMRDAARSYGFTEGRPVWQEGRKVTHMEADDQMERLLEGKIPDEREEALIEIEDEYLGGLNGS